MNRVVTIKTNVMRAGLTFLKKLSEGFLKYLNCFVTGVSIV